MGEGISVLPKRTFARTRFCNQKRCGVAPNFQTGSQIHFTGGQRLIDLSSCLQRKHAQFYFMAKLTVRDLEVKGKRVFMRVDYNVPLRKKTAKWSSPMTRAWLKLFPL